MDDITDPSMITTLDELGDAWSQLIEQAGLSQRRLADKSATGVGMVPLPRATISEILRGRRLPSREQLTTFLTMVGITNEDELQVWDEAWNRLREQQSRFGSQETILSLPMGTFLESGPKEAALRQLRRSIPEAAAELAKLGPGSAATILGNWPEEIAAEILAAMDVHVAAAVLLAHSADWHIAPVLRKMPRERAVACLEAMGTAGTVSRRLGWIGPWFLPKILRRQSDDPIFAKFQKVRRDDAIKATKAGLLIVVLGGVVFGIEWKLLELLDQLLELKHLASQSG
jgi:transcriptional regulator with XRE-family HTH domain